MQSPSKQSRCPRALEMSKGWERCRQITSKQETSVNCAATTGDPQMDSSRPSCWSIFLFVRCLDDLIGKYSFAVWGLSGESTLNGLRICFFFFPLWSSLHQTCLDPRLPKGLWVEWSLWSRPVDKTSKVHGHCQIQLGTNFEAGPSSRALRPQRGMSPYKIRGTLKSPQVIWSCVGWVPCNRPLAWRAVKWHSCWNTAAWRGKSTNWGFSWVKSFWK